MKAMLLADNQAMYGYRMSEQLWWIDTPSDYEQLQALASQGEIRLP